MRERRQQGDKLGGYIGRWQLPITHTFGLIGNIFKSLLIFYGHFIFNLLLTPFLNCVTIYDPLLVHLIQLFHTNPVLNVVLLLRLYVT